MNTTTTFTYSGFEGPEKLLEIWFSSSIDASLRSVEPAVWQDMLQVVQCKILSVLNNEHADAYLLSESSMFVYSNRLILKTCGTTTLLNSLPLIIKIAADIGLCTVDHLFYSRKSFLFPDLQEFPHGQWSDEVGFLDAIFLPHLYDTSAYVLGKTNHDHWFLYKSSRADLDSDGNSLDTAASIEAEANDFTLEILMTELNQDAMKCFWRNESELQQAKLPQNENALKHTFLDPKRLYIESGLSKIYPGALIDDYVFDPCGYSLNGLLGSSYFTIHVTPEESCSYASFETTISSQKAGESEYISELIKNVVGIFKPGKFTTTAIMKPSLSQNCERSLNGFIKGFSRKDAVIQSLDNWTLHFAHYSS